MQKIVFERNKCIGCGTCSVICPVHWKMGDDGRVDLKDATVNGEKMEKEIEEESCNGEAAQSCPMQCIHIVDV